MSKLRTIIVDDEPLALSLLKSKLKKIEKIEIIAECKNGREAIEQTLALSPDLIFLDIQMPGIDGFGVIKKLQADVVPLIVFTTAFEQYALDAFDVHAVDYILKPVDSERINRAVSRAEQLHKKNNANSNKPNIINAIHTMRQQENSVIDLTETVKEQPEIVLNESQQVSNNERSLDKKIVVKDRDDITLIKQTDIEWVDAAGDYVCIHVDGVTHIKRSTLTCLLKELDANIFKRVHRSTIVNLNFIQKVIPHTKGEFFLKLGEYDQVKVSRNYRDVIKKFLADD